MWQSLLILFGAIVGSGSLLILLSVIQDLISPNGHSLPGGTGMAAVFFFITAIGGFGLSFYTLRKKKHRAQQRAERRILNIIAEKKGRITPEEVAMVTEMTVNEARQELDRLCVEGAGELQVTESGQTSYVFSGFMSPEETTTATDPFDLSDIITEHPSVK